MVWESTGPGVTRPRPASRPIGRLVSPCYFEEIWTRSGFASATLGNRTVSIPFS